MAEATGPVLVTGTSSGIGRAITELLSSQGHEVIATARRRSDLEALARLRGVTPLRLDVTEDDEVGKIAQWIRDSRKGLYGLVNNAGVGGFGPLVETPVAELQRVLDVNLYGVHRVTRACFPFLKASCGRVVNISSVAGIGTMPFFAGYGVSKHALEGYSDILRSELASFGIRVSTIEPANFRSEINSNFAGDRESDLTAMIRRSEFADPLRTAVDYVTGGRTPDPHRSRFPAPRPVAEAVADALYSAAPRVRYLVVDAQEPEMAGQIYDRVLTQLSELNQGHAYTLSGEDLAARLRKVIP